MLTAPFQSLSMKALQFFLWQWKSLDPPRRGFTQPHCEHVIDVWGSFTSSTHLLGNSLACVGKEEHLVCCDLFIFRGLSCSVSSGAMMMQSKCLNSQLVNWVCRSCCKCMALPITIFALAAKLCFLWRSRLYCLSASRPAAPAQSFLMRPV
jgi:hypothetical protein